MGEEAGKAHTGKRGGGKACMGGRGFVGAARERGKASIGMRGGKRSKSL
jgi:hypothetical protein